MMIFKNGNKVTTKFGSLTPLLTINKSFAFTEQLTYSITTDFRYRDDPTNRYLKSAYINSTDPTEKAEGTAAWQETKTITWTVGSNAQIVHGTFLDGSPWVQENVSNPVYLLKVTPEPGVYTSKPTEDPPNTDFATNLTVINPDFGKIDNRSYGRIGVVPDVPDTVYDPTDSATFETKVHWKTTVDHVIRCTNDKCVVDGSGNPLYMLSLDERSGLTSTKNNNGKSLAGATGPGDCYDPSQVWNRQATQLTNGDMVLSAISHVDPNDAFWGGDDKAREPMYDMFGALTVVPNDGETYSTYYRPPVNWDPTLKTQRPYFKAKNQTTLDAFNMDFTGLTPFEAGDTWDAGLTTSKWFEPDFFFVGGDNNGLMSEKATPLRLGSIRLWAGATEMDDTVQGWTRDMACTHNEYGSWEQRDNDAMILMAFDGAVDPSLRNQIRHCLAQRGIDVYGAYRSQGKWNSPNGGHSVPYDWYLLYASAFVLDAADINAVMAGDIGMVDNNTNANLAANNDGKISGLGTCIGEMNIASPDRSKRFHPGRLRDLEVIRTGTDTDGVLFIDVAPPVANTLGRYVDVPGTDRTYYTVIGGDERSVDPLDGPGQGNDSMGRWATKNNVSEMQGKHFIGGYLKGPNGITRIVDSAAVDASGNIAAFDVDDNSWFTDRPQRFWIQDTSPIATASDQVDLSPYVMQDLDIEGGANRAQFIGINYSSDQIFNGGYNAYGYATTHSVFALPLLAKVLGGSANLPVLWQKSYENAKNYYTDPIKTSIVREPGIVSTSYYLGEINVKGYGNFWKAGYRKYALSYIVNDDGNWPPSALATPVDYSEDRAAKANIWRTHAPTAGANLTWDPLPAQPTGVTLIAEWPNTYPYDLSDAGNLPGNFSGAAWRLEKPDTAAIGNSNESLHRAGTIVTNEATPRDGFFLRSLDGNNRGISYSTYFSGKTVYVQLGGACEPIALERKTHTEDSDLAWYDEWVLPATTPRWPDTIDSWSHTNRYIIYVADPPTP